MSCIDTRVTEGSLPTTAVGLEVQGVALRNRFLLNPQHTFQPLLLWHLETNTELLLLLLKQI